MSKRFGPSIMSFFGKRAKPDSAQIVNQPSNEIENSGRVELPIVNINTTANELDVSSSYMDIANCIDKNIDDRRKYCFLKSDLLPERDYIFPFAERRNKDKVHRRYLQREHLVRYPFLAFSKEKKGLYCKNCFLFCNIQLLQASCGYEEIGLITKAMTQYTHLTDIVSKHTEKKYHKEATLKSMDFLHSYENPDANIDILLDQNLRDQTKYNRSVLEKIIRAIIFAGKCGLALRGRRDDGELLCPDDFNDIDVFSGNFRALLQYTAHSGCCDKGASTQSEKITNHFAKQLSWFRQFWKYSKTGEVGAVWGDLKL